METLFPCRTCLNEKNFEQVTDTLCTFECKKGHAPKDLKIYGAASQDEGKLICTDYAHEENAWW